MKKLLFLLIITSALCSQPFLKTAIRGFVYNKETGKPLENMQVKVYQDSDDVAPRFRESLISVTTTDSNGRFYVYGLNAYQQFYCFIQNLDIDIARAWVLKAGENTVNYTFMYSFNRNE